jgi:UDP-GlcNAc:undecaprenyl-phosphate GlcNAc-1-phosphate transferase
LKSLQVVLPVLAGFSVAHAVLPAIIRIARRRRLLDIPSESRRVHTHPIPRVGGVGVVMATVVAVVIVTGIGSAIGTGVPPSIVGLAPLAAAISVVFTVGLIDDLRGVAPRHKMAAQSIAALILLASGLKINVIALSVNSPGVAVPAWIGSALILVWLVGMTNAFNLIDGVDGLAGTVALIAAVATIGVEAVQMGRPPSIVTLAVIGSILAFLRFNSNPARIFLGDSGSMSIGFFLAAQSIRSFADDQGRFFALVPLFCLAFPLIDTTIAIARRWIRGEPLSRADGRHVHHQLLALGLSPGRTVEILGFFFLGIATLGVSIVFARPEFTLAMLGGAIVVLFATFWYGLRWLRYHEFVEFGASVLSVVRNARVAVQEKVRASEVASQVSSAATLDEVKALVSGLVDEVNLLDIEVIAPTDAVRSNGLSHQRIFPLDALPVHLDYPFAWTSDVGRRELVLRIWYPRPQQACRHTAERVAIRLTPALESWFKNSAQCDQTSDPHEAIRGARHASAGTF